MPGQTGVFGQPGDVGQVIIVDGVTRAILETFQGAGTPADGFGWALACADVDGDGKQDLLVGAPFTGVGGRVYVKYRDRTVTDTVISGVVTGGQFGGEMSDGTDLDGDGKEDFFIGAPWANTPSWLNGGIVYKFLTTNMQATQSLRGSASAMQVGFHLELGDFDSNANTSELAVGAFGWRLNDGTMGVYTTDMVTPRGAGLAGSDGNGTGFSFTPVGDLSGDGWTEWAIGEPFYSGIILNRGRVRVMDLRTGAVYHVFEGQAVREQLGLSVAVGTSPSGDFLAIGGSGTSSNEGNVRVFSLVTGDELFSALGTNPQSAMGIEVETADLNCDGYDDVIATEPGSNGATHIWSVTELDFTASGSEIPAGSGGSVDFCVEGPPNMKYLFLLSASGITPGFLFKGQQVCLNPDAYTMIFGAPYFPGQTGFTDGAGVGTATLTIPAGFLPPGFAVDLNVVAVTFGPFTSQPPRAVRIR